MTHSPPPPTYSESLKIQYSVLLSSCFRNVSTETNQNTSKHITGALGSTQTQLLIFFKCMINTECKYYNDEKIFMSNNNLATCI